MNRRVTAVSVLAAAGAAALAYAHPGHPPIVPPKVKFTATTDGAVPIHLFRGNRLFLDATVDGHVTSALLDSGAGMISLDSAFARTLGLTGGTDMMVGSAGGPVPAKLVSGVRITIGNLTLVDTTVIVFDLSGISRQLGRPVHAILGRELFDAAVVGIDVPRRRLTLTAPATFSPLAGAMRVSLTRTEGGIRQIPITIAGHSPVMAAFDLGHGGSLILSREYWEGENLLQGMRWASAQRGGVGGAVSMRIATLPRVTVGHAMFNAVPTLFNEDARDLPTHGANIGFDMLSRFTLAVDYSRDALYLTPVANMAAPLPKDRAGMRTELVGDKLKVTYIAPESPASAGGWRIGDEIIAIDGKRVDASYYSTGPNGWETGPADRVVRLRRVNGRDIPLKLANYF